MTYPVGDGPGGGSSSGGDTLLVNPDEVRRLVDQYYARAHAIREVVTAMNGITARLGGDLGNEKARARIDEIWRGWSGHVTNMADNLDSLVNLVNALMDEYQGVDRTVVSRPLHGAS